MIASSASRYAECQTESLEHPCRVLPILVRSEQLPLHLNVPFTSICNTVLTSNPDWNATATCSWYTTAPFFQCIFVTFEQVHAAHSLAPHSHGLRPKQDCCPPGFTIYTLESRASNGATGYRSSRRAAYCDVATQNV